MRVAKQLVAINHTIAALEYAGYKVVMKHVHGEAGSSTHIAIALFDEDSYAVELHQGHAFCSSEDQFSPREGAQIAFGRVMKVFGDNHNRAWILSIMSEYADDLKRRSEG
jgi:hypothetical protein